MLMAELTTANVGICSTCNHLQECISRFVNGSPIWFCEMFDDYVEPSQFKQMSRVEAEPSPNGFIGLCRNCENRFECALPKPEGGVWHCEEYK